MKQRRAQWAECVCVCATVRREERGCVYDIKCTERKTNNCSKHNRMPAITIWPAHKHTRQLKQWQQLKMGDYSYLKPFFDLLLGCCVLFNLPEVLLHVSALTLLSLVQKPQDALLKRLCALILGKLQRERREVNNRHERRRNNMVICLKTAGAYNFFLTAKEFSIQIHKHNQRRASDKNVLMSAKFGLKRPLNQTIPVSSVSGSHKSAAMNQTEWCHDPLCIQRLLKRQYPP